jgi:hypothetical protein
LETDERLSAFGASLQATVRSLQLFDAFPVLAGGWIRLRRRVRSDGRRTHERA